MGIDPMTFFAQIVNLFVLVWILKRFLYHPVLRIIQKRQDEINQEIQSVSLKTKEVDKMSLDLKKEKERYEVFEQQQKQALADEIKKVRFKEMTHLKEQINLLRQKSLETVKEEEQQLKSETLHTICQDFLNISEKVLTTLTEETPIDRILDLFMDKCSALTKKEKNRLNNSLKNQKVVFVNSSKDLTNNQKNKISSFLKKEFLFPVKCQIKYQTREDLIFGIELCINAITIDWSIQNYFDELGQNLNSSLMQNESVKE